jgi:hypothetical protein
VLTLLFASSAQAQSPDFIFSSYTCFPPSCVNEAGPTTVGSASASFDGVCTGGAIGGIEADAAAIIGINTQTGEIQACQSPYYARASFEVVRTEQLNDFCEPFLLDDVRQLAEVLDLFRFPVWYKEHSAGCDGGDTTFTSFGTKPC